jgi:hypothetical protein
MSAFLKVDMSEVTRLTEMIPIEAWGAFRSPSTWRRRPFPATHGQALKGLSPAGALAASKMAPPAGPIPDMLAARDRLARLGPRAGAGHVRTRPSRVPVSLADGARFEERTFLNHAGRRDYNVYVPSLHAGQPLPVVVMLHGCTQDPDDFAVGTWMNELAEEQMFLVVYPRQAQSANRQKCWNWFNAAEQQRGSVEPSIIAGIANRVVQEFSADPSRV